MRCTNCSTEASPSEDTCSKCGQPLMVTCPSCARLGRRDALFCGACGAYFGAIAATAAPLATAPHSERKHATVLFADIVGSTAAVASLDPEEAMERLRPVLDTLRRVAEEFEGTVVRVTGDGILALFGAPRALEGHAFLACRAARAMHAAIAALPSRLSIRAGLHSGEIVAAQIGSAALGDGAFGATLHLASRMEQLAPVGSTCLSAATYELVRSHFDLRFTGQHLVKGFDEPVDVYELRDVEAAPRDAAAAPASSPSFIGRARELALLERVLDSARQGQARVVGISASPGVGKSRLCREFARRCVARRVRVLTMRALAYGHATPYQPVLELLRALFRIAPGLSDERARARVRRVLQAIDPALTADVELVNDFLGLGTVPAPGLDPETRQNRLLGVIGHLVRVPIARPLVVIVEDLHWLDAASERFVRRLVFAAPSTHTFVLLNFRPGYDASWMRGQHCTLMPLAELGERPTRALALELIGPDPRLKDVRERVAVRSGGNPLFVDELVRSLKERGVLVGERGRYRLGRGGAAIELPSTIRSVLDARIDGPTEEDKPILQVASVIGLDFHLALLQPIVGRTMAELEISMAHLCAAGLVEPVSHREPVFAFRHPLIQEVAYSVQLKTRRSAIHAEVARAIEGFYGSRADEFSGLLSHHYEAAGQPVAAAQYLVRAALWIGRTDSTQALGYWKHACELVQDASRSVSNDTLRVLVNAQVVNYGWRAGMPESDAKRHSLEARHYARELGDRTTEALILAGYGRFIAATGSADAYSALVVEALDLLADANQDGRVAILKGQLAQACRFAGKLGAALTANTAALRKASSITKLDAQLVGFRPVPWIMSLRGAILVDIGRFAHARRWLDKVIALGDIEPVVQFIAPMAYVRMAWFLGDAGLAAEHAAGVARIAERSGVPYVEVYALRCSGLAKATAGDGEGALADLARALKLARHTRAARENEAHLLAEIADVQSQLGRDGDALETCRQAVALARRRKARAAECHARIVEWQVLARQADPGLAQQATAILQAAERLVASTGAAALGARLAGLRDAALRVEREA